MENDEKEAGKKRPNAGYELSKQDNDQSREGLVFHYSRERRLAKAPIEVQKLYSNEQQKSRFGLFSALVADRPRRFLFITVILLCIAVISLSRLGYLDSTYYLDGNKIEIRGTIYEGETIIVLIKNAQKADAYTGTVDIAVSEPIQEDLESPVWTHRIFFTVEDEEVYRFAVPFNSGHLLMVLQNDTSQVQLKFKAD